MKFLYHGKSLRGGKRLSKFPHYLKAAVYGNANNETNDVNLLTKQYTVKKGHVFLGSQKGLSVKPFKHDSFFYLDGSTFRA